MSGGSGTNDGRVTRPRSASKKKLVTGSRTHAIQDADNDEDRNPVSQVFPESIRRFTEAIQALRAYVKTVQEHLDREQDRFQTKNLIALSPTLYFQFSVSANKADSDRDREMFSEAQKNIRKMWGHLIEFRDDDQTMRIKSADGARLVETIKHAAEARNEIGRKQNWFREGAIVVALGLVEVLVTSMVRLKYRVSPEKLEGSDYTFTYSQLSEYPSIDDAREFLVEKRVTDSVYGGVSTWVNLLKGLYDLRCPYLESWRGELEELQLRRNAIVHTEGRVNRRYLDAARARGMKAELGDRIYTDSVYLEKTLNMLEAAFTLIAADVWSRLAPTDERQDIAGFLVQLSYDALRSSRWDIAISLAKFVEEDKNIDQLTRLSAKINRWQGYKWSGRFKEIKPEVIQQDKSGLSLVLELAFHALLDEKDAFFEKFENALKIGALETWAAREWPVFNGMRKDSRFEMSLKAFGFSEVVEKKLTEKELAQLLAASSAVSESTREAQPSIGSIEEAAPLADKASKGRRKRTVQRKRS